MDGMASHQTLADLSRETNGRSPMVWQIELIDQVTLQQPDADQGAPEEGGDRTLPRPGEKPAGDGR